MGHDQGRFQKMDSFLSNFQRKLQTSQKCKIYGKKWVLFFNNIDLKFRETKRQKMDFRLAGVFLLMTFFEKKYQKRVIMKQNKNQKHRKRKF